MNRDRQVLRTRRARVLTAVALLAAVGVGDAALAVAPRADAATVDLGVAAGLVPSAEPVPCADDYPDAVVPPTGEVISFPSWWCSYPPDSGPCADGTYVLPHAQLPHLSRLADLRRQANRGLQQASHDLYVDGDDTSGEYLALFAQVLDRWGAAYENAMADRCAGRR